MEESKKEEGGNLRIGFKFKWWTWRERERGRKTRGKEEKQR